MEKNWLIASFGSSKRPENLYMRVWNTLDAIGIYPAVMVILKSCCMTKFYCIALSGFNHS